MTPTRQRPSCIKLVVGRRKEVLIELTSTIQNTKLMPMAKNGAIILENESTDIVSHYLHFSKTHQYASSCPTSFEAPAKSRHRFRMLATVARWSVCWKSSTDVLEPWSISATAPRQRLALLTIKNTTRHNKSCYTCIVRLSMMLASIACHRTVRGWVSIWL